MSSEKKNKTNKQKKTTIKIRKRTLAEIKMKKNVQLDLCIHFYAKCVSSLPDDSPFKCAQQIKLVNS